jgi:hypothetical protein
MERISAGGAGGVRVRATYTAAMIGGQRQRFWRIDEIVSATIDEIAANNRVRMMMHE